MPYFRQHPERYEAWRGKSWEENSLRELLETLRLEDKALLKVLAEADGAMRQDALMQRLPMLRGKSSASLRSLKAHINAACKQLDRAPVLSVGSGSGRSRRHEISPDLGPLRQIVIAVASSFDVDWRLLEPAEGTDSTAAAQINRTPTNEPHNQVTRKQTPSENKAWYVTSRAGKPEIAAFVNAKGSCSYRSFTISGKFVGAQRSRGEFAIVFSGVIGAGRRFFPNHQPALMDAEKNGLPAEVVDAANATMGR